MTLISIFDLCYNLSIMNKKSIIKFITFFLFFILILAFVMVLLYLYLPNKIIASKKFQNYVSTLAKDNLGLDLVIENPNLKTKLKPEVELTVKSLKLTKNSNALVVLDDFSSCVDFGSIFDKKIKLKKLLAKNLTLKSDELLKELKIKEQQSEQKFEYNVDLYDSEILLEKMFVSFKQPNQTLLKIDANNIKLNCKKDFKELNFNLNGEILNKGSNFAKIAIDADSEIKIFDDNIKINNLKILVNKSNLLLTSKIDKDSLFFNAKSEKFYLEDVFALVNSNFIIPNGKELLSPLANPSGSVKFDVNSLNNNLSGYISVDNTKATIKDLTSIPINIQKGKIALTKDKIDFIDLNGYYGKNKRNTINITGNIKDYYKTFDSNIDIRTMISNEFLKDYLSPLIQNTQIRLSKPTKTKITYKAKNGIMDIVWLAGVPKGVDLNVNNSKSALSAYDRAVEGDFNINGNTLNIKNINYYISSNMQRGVKLTPILVLNGKMKLTGEIENAGFYFGRQMPCEFLNIFTREKTFKKGTVQGRLNVVFKNNIPTLNADMQIEKTILPAQRLFIKSAKLTTDNDLIKVALDGGFKRIKYNFEGKIKNELNPPFVIKDMKLDLDNVDVEKLLLSMNADQQNTKNTDNINSENDIEADDDDYFFDTNLVRIENSTFNLKKGNYKELAFSDINAKMTLDEKGILKIQSNRFNIANGISTLKVESDLKNFKHYVRLGVKDIDSNLMAKVLLNLDKEISGSAKGLIELNTDKSMKLNGKIRFAIDDGAIGKIGLVEYLLKVASVFRNPIVMISPSVIMDIVNIPEGKFNKITGTINLKDNVAYGIDIRSVAPTLSALVRGRFDMDKHDASLRIYTRFSTDKKSMFGFFRNISLNALANKVQLYSKNDLHYYSSELVDLPQIEIGEDKSQIFLTQVEGDVENNNYLSSLKKIK